VGFRVGGFMYVGGSVFYVQRMIDSIDNIYTDSLGLVSCVGDSLIANADTVYVQDIIPRVQGLFNIPWLDLSLVGLLIITVFILATNKKQYLFQIGNLLSRSGRKVAYDVETQGRRGRALLLIMAIVADTLFLIFLLKGRVDVIAIAQNAALVSYIACALGGIFLLKYIVLQVGGYIFKIRNQAIVYRKSYFILILIQGTLLLPIDLAVVCAPALFASICIILGIIIIVFTFIFVVFKAVQIFFNGAISLFYVFLYLCTVEIMPFLLLVKAVLIL
jgi:hypothetical protein